MIRVSNAIPIFLSVVLAVTPAGWCCCATGGKATLPTHRDPRQPLTPTPRATTRRISMGAARVALIRKLILNQV